MLPVIEPAPLVGLKLFIDHPNWLYELKHDGFRGMLYVDRDRAWLRSRKGNEMQLFNALKPANPQPAQGTACDLGWRDRGPQSGGTLNLRRLDDGSWRTQLLRVRSSTA